MAYENTLTTVTALAAADYSTTGQYLGVKLTSTANTFETCDTNGEQVYGVLQNAPGSGEEGTIATGGITKAEAGGAIAIGAQVAVDDDGRFITAATGDVIVGFARTAGTDGAIFSLDLRTYLGTAS